MDTETYPPDNAALLYLQAGMLARGMTVEELTQLYECVSGENEVNEEIKKRIKASDMIIDLLKKAAKIPDCDWGLRQSPDLMLSVPHITSCKYLASLVLLDARICLKDENFKQAIEHSITAV